MKAKITIFFIGLVVGATLFFFTSKNMVPQSPESTDLTLQGPDGYPSLRFKVTGSGVDYRKLLENMFSDNFFRQGALSWLEQNQKSYSLSSTGLVTAVANSLCKPIPSSPLSERIRKEKECANKPVVHGLRELAFNRIEPFHYVGNLGKMGIPGRKSDQPKQGYANVCRPGEYVGKTLQVGNTAGSNVIEVVASGYYVCTDASSDYPDIQLSPDDANVLFPHTPFGKTEQVVIVPIN